MFASHPAQTISLPRPSQDIPARWLVSTIDRALGALHAGGVHINCPFAEPLYGDMDETGVEWQQQLGNWWQSDKPSAAPGAAVREREAARLVLLATKTRRRRGGQNERRGREKGR